jgi:RNA polymerase sigma-70 factor (ECF subfamily)
MGSDEALYARWIAGDLSAFDQLYARFERPLYGFVRAYVRDATEAEDVLHEAFLAVLRERARDIRSFRAWIFEVARHLCQNRVRSRKRAARATEAMSAEQVPAPPAADEQLDARRRAVTLERAVARLPETLSTVYRLRATGMSYDEVAEVLDVPVGTVKSRMHEMVARLKEEVSR